MAQQTLQYHFNSTVETPQTMTAAAAVAEGQPWLVEVANPTTLLRMAPNQGFAPPSYISIISAETGVYADILATSNVYIPRTVTILVAI